MKKEIIINATLNEIRVAITEDRRLAELFWELPDRERSLGNIYLGKVQRIVQGMNAAFLDIGLKQDAFLHFSDVGGLLEEDAFSEDEDEDDEDSVQNPQEVEETLSEAASIALRRKKSESKSPLPTFDTKRSGQVVINLEEKQYVIVQAIREAYAGKGLRVTTKVSLPGRYLVLLPFDEGIGVSKKILNIKERKRLRRLAKSILPDGVGCIIRTVAEDKDEAELLNDLRQLVNKWKAIEDKVKRNQQSGLLYQDMNLTGSLIRDLFTSDVTRVVIDSKKFFTDVKDYIATNSPNLADKVEYYAGPEPLFDAFGIEKEVEKCYARKVSLPSGGYLIFDHTEAMVVVDVNSGRYAAQREQEMNSLITNLEALKEIARQIRLRDIGGMIVIDFIDLQEEKNRRRIYDEMKNNLRFDRAKTVVFPLSQLGLLQITRQRIRQNILQVITEPCPTCDGVGVVESKFMIINAIERWLKRFKSESREFRLILSVHPSVAHHLVQGTFSKLAKLMIKYFVKISIQPNEYLAMDEFQFFSIRRQKDITKDYNNNQ